MGALTDPCVIKGTHGCNMTILLPEGAPRNERAIRATVRRWLDTDFYRTGWREAPYRGLPRRAVVERFIGEGGAPPSDYKFFVFNGKVGMVVVDQDRFSAHTSTMLHPDWHAFAVEGGTFDVADELPGPAAELRRDAGGGPQRWPPTSRSPASTSTTSTAASTSARSPTTPAAASSGCGRARSTGRWASCGATARRSPSASSAAPAQPSLDLVTGCNRANRMRWRWPRRPVPRAVGPPEPGRGPRSP